MGTQHIRMKFQTKLMLVVVLILSLDTLFAGGMYYNYAYKDTIDNYYQNADDMTEQINTYLTEHISGITNKVTALSNNMTFASAMKQFSSGQGAENYSNAIGIISDNLSQFELSDQMIDSVYVYTEYGDFDNFIKIRNMMFDFRKSEMYQYFVRNPKERMKMFSATAVYVYKGDEEIIPIVYNVKVGTTTVYFAVALKSSYLKSVIHNNYATFDRVYLTNDELQNVINVTTVEDYNIISMCKGLAEDQRTLMVNDHTYVVSRRQMKVSGWNIYGLKSMDQLTNHLENLKFIIITQLIVAVVVMLLIGAILFGRLTRPLVQLSGIMDRAITSGFRVKFEYDREDEIGQLANSFNYMVEETDQLVTRLDSNIIELKQEKENLRLEQEAKRKAELKALQAQINPHFLYNTLNTISWQAAALGANEVCTLTNLLGKFFRSSLSKGREYVTIREEVEQVHSYLEIQKIRYQNKMDFITEVPEELLPFYTVKLVLQPLVENAIYHGVKESEGKGIIRVYGRFCPMEEKTRKLQLIVEDNGAGIAPEHLKLLNEKLEAGVVDSSTGYGIYNVNERLNLSFGREYGLRLESVQGEYTKSVLTLPLIDKEPKTDKEAEDA